jgi:hypothetical protein
MSCNWGTDRLAEAVFFWGSKRRTENRQQSDQHNRERSTGIGDVAELSDSAERNAVEGGTTRERKTEHIPDKPAAIMELK